MRQPRRNVQLRFDIFSPVAVFVAFFMLQEVFVYLYVLANFAQRTGARLPYGLSMSDINVGMLTMLIYAALWCCGFFLFGGRAYTRTLGGRFLSFEWHTATGGRSAGQALGPRLRLALSVCLLTLVYLLILHHPLRGVEGARSMYTQGWYGRCLFLCIAAATVCYWYVIAAFFDELRVRRLGLQNRPLYALAILATGIGLFFALVQLGGRARALTPLAMALFIVNYEWVRVRVSTAMVALLGVIIAAVVLSGRADLSQFTIFDFLFGTEGGRTFDGLYNISLILRSFDASGPYLWGSGMANGVLSDVGLQFGETSREALMRRVFGVGGDVLAGVNPTKAGELYMNFGYIGSFSGAFLYGAISAWVQREFIDRRRFRPLSTIIYLVFVMLLGLPKTSGYVFENVVYSMAFLACTVLIYQVCCGGCRRGTSRMRGAKESAGR